ncbi:MAG: hypothetical protein MOB07_16580 [Acidobacteria bacterium]|nr:hypothetical protein [Acidobacteriota bacterium]
MNYFNYFTEIEEEFVKRRGSHLLVSPLDWSLMETWKQRGVPLHIVLRGINASFDAYDQRAFRGRKVNSLLYCQQEIEASFLEYCQSRVGSNDEWRAENGKKSNGRRDDDSTFTQSAIINYLTEHHDALQQLSVEYSPDAVLSETFARATIRLSQIIDDLRNSNIVSPESLEIDLTMIEEVILDGLKISVGEDRRKQLLKEGNKQLQSYRQSMEREVYQQTLDNFIARRLREQYHVPRLSLFYL